MPGSPLYSLRKVLFGLVLSWILVGCATATNPITESVEPVPEEPIPTRTLEPSPEPTRPPPTALPEPTPTAEPPTPAISTDNQESFAPATEQQGVTIQRSDDRRNLLKSRTEDWNTNWLRRLIDTDELLSGGPPRDGIPSIDDPQFIAVPEASDWLADNEPVILLELNGEARAYPLQVLTWHEIANDTVGGTPVVVTFCPLCNSALAFDRRVGTQTLEFGVSGLLRNSDLVMYDRTTETLWQQFTGDALVGELVPLRLKFYSTQIISFGDFAKNFPDGRVLSRETGFNRPYGQNPYAGYDTYEHPLSQRGQFLLFQGEIDGRLAPAARVVTVGFEAEGFDIAYPVESLAELGVINDSRGGFDLVVFYMPGTASALGAAQIASAEDVGATGVFDPIVNDQKLTFSWVDGVIVDDQTGSSWNILGIAESGPLAGSRLTPLVHGDHFWFSWAAFKPETVVYGLDE